MAQVLVADDNFALRTILRFNLQRAGYEVKMVSDGLEAWEALQSTPCDLLTLDHNMPVLCGLDLCRRIRNDQRFSRLPLILVSGSHLRDEESRAYQEIQLSAIFIKPFSPMQVVQTVNSLLCPEAAANSLEAATCGSWLL